MKKKPLDLFFKEAVGLIEKTEEIDLPPDQDLRSKGVGDMKEKLMHLERNLKIRIEKENVENIQRKQEAGIGEASSRLFSLFAKPSDSEKKYNEEAVRMGRSKSGSVELSEEMVRFVDCLFKEGYLVNGNFLKKGQLDLNCLTTSYSQDYLKFAAERFGHDHDEVARWLSGSDLKKVALFGCPSVERKTVFAAKSLRSFFSIQEDTVCRSCKLKDSCKLANQRVLKRRKLITADALRVLTMYGLELVPQQLVVTDEIKVSISKLLKQVVDLSK